MRDTKGKLLEDALIFITEFLAVKHDVSDDGMAYETEIAIIDNDTWEALREDAQAALDAAKATT